MQILYLSSASGPDYQCDMLFHGLRALIGPAVTDVNRLWYMYRSDLNGTGIDLSKLYGKGFTLYGLMEDDVGIDRDDIENKIKCHFFNFIIFGSIRRCQSFLLTVLEFYKVNEIAFIDGEDLMMRYLGVEDAQEIFYPLVGRGIYFKRELRSFHPAILPIHFAIPSEKIFTIQRPKSKAVAIIDPRNPSTYVYDTEIDYYSDYAESLFGVTMRKGGWDCLRHYEMMANSCVPYFLNIDACPPLTLSNIPKFELWEASRLFDQYGADYFWTPHGQEMWANLQEKFASALRLKSTTIALAKYVLGQLGN